mmetsp:Transcript_57355/g.134473  ORF Transcript_57355/g.134473 Transcript_57355/m.134473 type:complete len:91 (-) Transcript_57355:391-663(-)
MGGLGGAGGKRTVIGFFGGVSTVENDKEESDADTTDCGVQQDDDEETNGELPKDSNVVDASMDEDVRSLCIASAFVGELLHEGERCSETP